MTNANAQRPAPPVGNAPDAPSLGLRALIAIGGSGYGWRHAVRSGLCVGLPVLIGWALGNEPYGLVASIGGFAGLYGANEAFRRRASIIATAGLTLVAAVVLGQLGSFDPWLGVGLVTAFAGLLVLVMMSLRSGPPGPYLIVLVAALGTVPHHTGAPFWQTPELIAAGAALAWLIQMSGWLLGPRRPQRRVTVGACRIVQAYVAVLGTSREDRARSSASSTLFSAWDKLADTQGSTDYYRTLADANALFSRAAGGHEIKGELQSDAASLVARAEALPSGWRNPARSSTAAAAGDGDPPSLSGTDGGSSADDAGRPAGATVRPFGPIERLAGRLRDGFFGRHSKPRNTALRVLAATAISGSIGVALGLDHMYWVMAASVLVLHMGAPRVAALRRAIHRFAGTIVGSGAAVLLIAVHPRGWQLAVVLAVLQVCIELSMSRNYAIGVAFVTPVALLNASTLNPQSHDLVAVRTMDTVVGLAVAVVVLLATTRSEHVPRLAYYMAGALDSVDATLALLDRAHPERDVRRSAVQLEHRLIGLQSAFDSTNDESAAGHRAAAERWPSMVAIQRLGYDVLATAWAAGRGRPPRRDEVLDLADEAWLARAAL